MKKIVSALKLKDLTETCEKLYIKEACRIAVKQSKLIEMLEQRVNELEDRIASLESSN